MEKTNKTRWQCCGYPVNFFCGIFLPNLIILWYLKNYLDKTYFRQWYLTRKFELQGSFLWLKDPTGSWSGSATLLGGVWGVWGRESCNRIHRHSPHLYIDPPTQSNLFFKWFISPLCVIELFGLFYILVWNSFFYVDILINIFKQLLDLWFKFSL